MRDVSPQNWAASHLGLSRPFVLSESLKLTGRENGGPLSDLATRTSIGSFAGPQREPTFPSCPRRDSCRTSSYTNPTMGPAIHTKKVTKCSSKLSRRGVRVHPRRAPARRTASSAASAHGARRLADGRASAHGARRLAAGRASGNGPAQHSPQLVAEAQDAWGGVLGVHFVPVLCRVGSGIVGVALGAEWEAEIGGQSLRRIPERAMRALKCPF